MSTIGASLTIVEPGFVEIRLPYRADLCQQHGFLHAGITTTIADSSCGYAAFSLMPAGVAVLTVEYKANFLAPASGEWFMARGKVVRPGKQITVCTAEVVAVTGNDEKLICILQATITNVPEQAALKG